MFERIDCVISPDEFLGNVSLFLNETNENMTIDTNSNSSVTPRDVTGNSGAGSKSVLGSVENFIYTKMMLIVGLFGLVGNVLNLIVLSRKSLTLSMERMEKSAHYGLIGLAVSDMLFCVAILPYFYVGPGKFGYPRLDFALIYQVYGHPIINTLILSSTWLTVTMAFSRFLAICYPLQGRQFIGKTFAVASLALVFFSCVLFNVPRYLWKHLSSLQCANGMTVYFTLDGPMKSNPTLERVYLWLYFGVGIVVPLVILVFCNTHLIIALKRSARMRMESHASHQSSSAANRITLTLVILVVMYVLLFVPAELLNFFKDRATVETTDAFNLVVAVFNLLQAINFAVNFILYCVINTHFRQTIWRIVCSEWCGAKRFAAKTQNSRYSLNRHYGSLTDATSFV